MLQKMFPNKRTSLLFISGLLVLLLVPFLLITRPGAAVKASGGGGCYGGTPSVNIYPTTSSPGTWVYISGSCYPANAKVKSYFQTTSNGVITAYTDQNGFFNSQLLIPSKYVQGTRYYIHVNSSTFSVKTLFTFTTPSLSIYPGGYGGGGSPTFGSSSVINGSGFAAYETVNLVWKDSVTGTTNAAIAGADAYGNVYATLSMPSFPFGSKLQLIGTGKISKVSASTVVQVIPAIIVKPASGVIGTTVTVKGGGFGNNDTIKIVFQNAKVAKTQANGKGAFTTSFVVPSTATIGYGYNAIVASGQKSGAAANASFGVEPNLSISPNKGPAGTYVLVKGSHFTHSGLVTILLISPISGGSGGSGGGQIFLTSFNALPNGSFNVTVQIPAGLLPGNTYFIQAIDDQTGGSNQVKFRVL